MAADGRPDPELQALARHEDGRLDAASRARILAAVRDQGPGVVKRAQVRRRVTQGASLLGALALVSAGAFALVEQSSPEPGLPSAAPLAETRPCEARPRSEAVLRAAEGGDQVLDLGARAFVRVEAESVLRIAENERCRLVLTLERGRVDVHARDLGAGELLVTTQEAEVRVRGTVFSVARDAGLGLTVDVAEGRVEVTAGEEPSRSLRGGQRLRRRAETVEQSPLASEAERRLLASVGLVEDTALQPIALDEADEAEEDVPRPRGDGEKRKRRRSRRRATPPPRTSAPEAAPSPQPEPGPEPAPEAQGAPVETLDSLLALAERLKRSGDLSGARRALRRAGEMRGADARAAWIALARLELQAGRTAEVRRAVREYERRGGGPLEPEGAWLAVRAEERAGRLDEARAEAAALIQRWPRTPQADEARRWLSQADAGLSP